MASDKTVKVNLKADISDYNRKMLEAAAITKGFTKELNTSTDRATNLTQSILAIGPALVPLGAAGIPAISGLTNQMAFAAAGAGVTALAFSGVGDALKATNDYALEPTAANFDKMQQTLAELGPAGRDFVGFLQEIRPQLQGLQDAAQEGLLPGAERGLTDLMTRLPQFERVVSEVASGIGDLIAEAGDNLADPRWTEFFDFVEREARPTLMDMGRTLGNFVEGFANLWMAFEPVSSNFSKSFLELSRDFSAWTDGLDQTEGFQEFLDYINRVGPKAWDTLGAVGNAFVEIVEAAAPIGEATLPIISALADTIATIADSPLGPTTIGLVSLASAYSRLIALGGAANSSALGGLFGKSAYGGMTKAGRDLPAASRAYLDFGAALSSAGPQVGKFASTTERLKASMRGAGGIAAGVGGLAFVMSDLDTKLGVSNAATLGLAGSMAGPLGAALGVTTGLAMDFSATTKDLNAALENFDSIVAGGGSYDQQAEALKAAHKEFEKYKDDVESFNLKDLMVTDFGTIKNGFQGIFGKSEVEKQSDAMRERGRVLEDNLRATQDAAFEEAGFGDSLDSASDATREQTAALLENVAAMNAKANAALTARDAERALEEALDNAAAAAKKNGKNTDIDSPGGRDNQEKLDGIAVAWNNLDVASQRASGAQAETRRAFVRTAVQMGYMREEAIALADSLLEIPTQVPVDIRARGAAKTKNDIQAIKDALAALPRTTDLTIRTFRETYGRPAGGSRENGVPGKADGGLILGPGGPRDDMIPAWLSNGEFVVNAAATRENLGLLHQINSSKVQRFADGGYAGAAVATAAGGSISLVGAQVAIDPHTNIATFVRGEIRMGLDQQTRYDAASRRQERRS
jgi:hypothetical protein